MGSPDVNDDPEKLVPTATNTSTGVPRAGSVGDIVGEDVEADGKYGKTKRGLKSRHAQMIALGGSIGTGSAYPRRVESVKRCADFPQSLRRHWSHARDRRPSLHPRRVHHHVRSALVHRDRHH